MIVTQDLIQEAITDLRNKAENIINISKDVNDPSIADIKNKTVDAMNMAISKITESIYSLTNLDEIQDVLKVVKNKSQELYENAVNKITEYQKENSIEENSESIVVPDLINNVLNYKYSSQYVDQDFNKNVDDNKLNDSLSFNEKIILTLKDWIEPEEK